MKFWCLIGRLSSFLMSIASLALAAMITVTFVDVVLRQFNASITGVYDIVGTASAVALAFALPGTTAAKGHIAVEFFHHKLKRKNRRIVDLAVHVCMALALLFTAWHMVSFGLDFKINGEVTPTLQIPKFWAVWCVSAGCLLSGVISVFLAFWPGKELPTKCPSSK